MADLVVRGIDEQLKFEMQNAALQARKSVKQFVIDALTVALNPVVVRESRSAQSEVKVEKPKKTAAPKNFENSEKAPVAGSCSECGGINGQHQKNCSRRWK